MNKNSPRKDESEGIFRLERQSPAAPKEATIYFDENFRFSLEKPERGSEMTVLEISGTRVLKSPFLNARPGVSSSEADIKRIGKKYTMKGCRPFLLYVVSEMSDKGFEVFLDKRKDIVKRASKAVVVGNGFKFDYNGREYCLYIKDSNCKLMHELKIINVATKTCKKGARLPKDVNLEDSKCFVKLDLILQGLMAAIRLPKPLAKELLETVVNCICTENDMNTELDSDGNRSLHEDLRKMIKNILFFDTNVNANKEPETQNIETASPQTKSKKKRKKELEPVDYTSKKAKQSPIMTLDDTEIERKRRKSNYSVQVNSRKNSPVVNKSIEIPPSAHKGSWQPQPSKLDMLATPIPSKRLITRAEVINKSTKLPPKDMIQKEASAKQKVKPPKEEHVPKRSSSELKKAAWSAAPVFPDRPASVNSNQRNTKSLEELPPKPRSKSRGKRNTPTSKRSTPQQDDGSPKPKNSSKKNAQPAKRTQYFASAPLTEYELALSNHVAHYQITGSTQPKYSWLHIPTPEEAAYAALEHESSYKRRKKPRAKKSPKKSKK